MKAKIDRMAVLGHLERIQYEKGQDPEQDQLEQMSLPSSLLVLAEIDHEREYLICRTIAEHLLGKLDEPEDIELQG